MNVVSALGGRKRASRPADPRANLDDPGLACPFAVPLKSVAISHWSSPHVFSRSPVCLHALVGARVYLHCSDWPQSRPGWPDGWPASTSASQAALSCFVSANLVFCCMRIPRSFGMPPATQRGRFSHPVHYSRVPWSSGPPFRDYTTCGLLWVAEHGGSHWLWCLKACQGLPGRRSLAAILRNISQS